MSKRFNIPTFEVAAWDETEHAVQLGILMYEQHLRDNPAPAEPRNTGKTTTRRYI